ncbi:hypothetical protein K431DRAFT_342167 [Polychaeton citri CBS 116435]|uniref:Saccharopine dehydrogenase [NAD(+), L-lysine-forming] n=1 Tax=Polychaeton citri CBS 116435 TaxID=1314669 RepID=A0A9P4PYF0_9PEZI|nr:hypothetical protein K431DRAFT_342167 [Polychaeton citri CBS 116435]
MSAIGFHLRAENYPVGLVTSITPETARSLLDEGFEVKVESSNVRIYKDQEYEAVGAQVVPAGSWTVAPPDHIIVGIKQIDDDTFPVTQTHYFASHYYKEQKGWSKGLRRFAQGGGILLDRGWIKRVTGFELNTFEPLTGFSGACMAMKVWEHQLSHPHGPSMDALPQYRMDGLLVEAQHALEGGRKLAGKLPRIILLGARGRCGKAVMYSLEKIGLPAENVIQWGRTETSQPGPYHDILQSDILINCAFVAQPGLGRKLSVIIDISCDSNGPYHPLPVYNSGNSLEQPTQSIDVPTGPPLTVSAIGYLPVIVAAEASDVASRNNLPLFRLWRDYRRAEVWRKLEKLFFEKLNSLPDEKFRSLL